MPRAHYNIISIGILAPASKASSFIISNSVTIEEVAIFLIHKCHCLIFIRITVGINKIAILQIIFLEIVETLMAIISTDIVDQLFIELLCLRSNPKSNMINAFHIESVKCHEFIFIMTR